MISNRIIFVALASVLVARGTARSAPAPVVVAEPMKPAPTEPVQPPAPALVVHNEDLPKIVPAATPAQRKRAGARAVSAKAPIENEVPNELCGMCAAGMVCVSHPGEGCKG